jgi:hypothetical protein
MSRLEEELGVYARHVLALFWPNKFAPTLVADKNKPGRVDDWDEEELRLLIEEGRRQLDRQHEDLERIRGRSQVVLAIGLALEGSIASLQSQLVTRASCWIWALWVLALLAGGWATLGAGATSVVRADMEIIHSAVLSRRDPPVLPGLAADYAAMTTQGEDQLATRLTNLRYAVVWLLVAAFLGLIAWLAA